jgi:hypothetical protein
MNSSGASIAFNNKGNRLHYCFTLFWGINCPKTITNKVHSRAASLNGRNVHFVVHPEEQMSTINLILTASA